MKIGIEELCAHELPCSCNAAVKCQLSLMFCRKIEKTIFHFGQWPNSALHLHLISSPLAGCLAALGSQVPKVGKHWCCHLTI
jgi:hypothetical protein